MTLPPPLLINQPLGQSDPGLGASTTHQIMILITCLWSKYLLYLFLRHPDNLEAFLGAFPGHHLHTQNVTRATIKQQSSFVASPVLETVSAAVSWDWGIWGMIRDRLSANACVPGVLQTTSGLHGRYG